MAVEERILAAEQAGDRAVQFHLEPGGKFLEFARLVAFLAAQHRYHQVAHVCRAGSRGMLASE